MIKGLDFDDVLLVPNYSHLESRRDVSTTTRLGRYEFPIPVISANMDTITGVEMSKAISRVGGLPILHRFVDIETNEKITIVIQCWNFLAHSMPFLHWGKELFSCLHMMHQ